ncbi:prostatic acid phosphatase [Spea bombifrons]|uniref:prostatic acid phosphatase n=1 Tax=Spea bombifrons TaxID=233779 RepID=UPI00234B35A8|nr:prostatic acid phosphatase [Spea bombifrons]
MRNICSELILVQNVAERQLKTVVLVYQHGDRSPAKTYPYDKYQEGSWPDGFGQLTNIGKQQHYELGKYLRKRYTGFLNESYNRHEVYVRSTDFDRTLMSALTNLAGLFPPVGRHTWNPDIMWQPVPVHTVPLSKENLILLPYQNCPRYQDLDERTYISEEYHRLIDPYSEFLKVLSNYTGFSVQQLKHGHAWTTYDALHCESIHNYSLPSWATEETMIKLRELSEFLITLPFGIYKQREKSRLQGGFLLNTIITNITDIISKPSRKRKLIVYSAHDTTIVALQIALSVFNKKMPPYAACHIFELYQEVNGNYSIEMYYRNDSAVDPYPLILPGCRASCPLQTFIELTSPVITLDWKTECGIIETPSASVIGLAVIVTLLVISAMVFLVVICYKKLFRRANYNQME